MTRKVLWDIRQWWSVSDTSESPFWSTFFGTHKLPVALCSCILITKCITNFLASLLFPCNFTDSFIFWSLFSSLPWVVVGCPFFLLFVFSSSLVAHFQDVCWTFSQLLADFLYVSILFSFLHSASKTSSRSRHYFTFYSSKKSLLCISCCLFI